MNSSDDQSSKHSSKQPLKQPLPSSSESLMVNSEDSARKGSKANTDIFERLQYIGRDFVDIFHYIILFSISVVVVWTAGVEFLTIIQKGSADLKDILMLFIYLELLAMIGIYFRTHRLPVQFLIFIAITALSRHLVVDVQAVSANFHLWLLATISFAIMVLSLSIVVLTWTAKMFGRPEDYFDDHQSPTTEHHLPSDNLSRRK